MRVVRIFGEGEGGPEPTDRVVLAHHERRVRRRRLETEGGGAAMIDLPHARTLRDGDRLVGEDGRSVLVVAAHEPLMEVTARDARHLALLAWQIGNRHLPAQIEATLIGAGRILLARDRVIADMLRGLGAAVREIEGPFTPEAGAYGDHHHAH